MNLIHKPKRINHQPLEGRPVYDEEEEVDGGSKGIGWNRGLLLIFPVITFTESLFVPLTTHPLL